MCKFEHKILWHKSFSSVSLHHHSICIRFNGKLRLRKIPDFPLGQTLKYLGPNSFDRSYLLLHFQSNFAQKLWFFQLSTAITWTHQFHVKQILSISFLGSRKDWEFCDRSPLTQLSFKFLWVHISYSYGLTSICSLTLSTVSIRHSKHNVHLQILPSA